MTVTTSSEPTSAVAPGAAIRPFQIDIPEEAIADLRRRASETRWPARRPSPTSPGRRSGEAQALVEWAGDYDWRKIEARLNALPQFTTEIDGVDIHFIPCGRP
jgi:hypothetical protein